MSVEVRVKHLVRLPDPIRVERARRLPELGPKILFVSGGSALRPLSRILKRYTHRSIHLITPFDSGGSSAKLRDAFQMVSVGDLRNRLMALADETIQGNPETYALFSHRLPEEGDPDRLLAELRSLVEGEHPLVAALFNPMRTLVRTYLRNFAENLPDDFDLRGASVGNLMLAGGYLANERDIDSVVFLFSKLVEVRGLVRAVTNANLHLAAKLRNGKTVVGQHRITGKRDAPLDSEIEELYLVESLDSPERTAAPITGKVQRLIVGADLFCYPIGSFYTSVLANLLPTGTGQAICQAGCPKVFVPNSGGDPEQGDMPVQECVSRLIEYVQRTAGDVPVQRILDMVLVDTRHGLYGPKTDWDAVRSLGVEVADLDLVRPDDPRQHDPQQLGEALISLSS